MSLAMSNAVWEKSQSRGSARLVMLALADHANDAGEAWPSLSRLAQMCNIDRSGVIRHLAALEEAGEIKRQPGNGRNTRYLIILTSRNSATSRKNATSRTSATPPVAPVHKTSRTSATLTIKNHQEPSLLSFPTEIENPNKQPEPCEATEAFNAWNAIAKQHGLPTATKMTTKRKTALRARIADAGDLDAFKAIIAAVPKSAFLTGRTREAYRAHLDFICQPSSFEKLRDGVYHGGVVPFTKPQPADDDQAVAERRARAARLLAYDEGIA